MEPFSRYTSFYPKKGDTTPYWTLWVSTNDYVTQEADPDDEWSRASTAENLVGYGVCVGAPLNVVHDIGRSRSLDAEQLGFAPAVGDMIYLVIESYADGDTFGHDDPLYRPVKAFPTEEAARKWLTSNEAALCKENGYFGGHNGYQIELVEVTA